MIKKTRKLTLRRETIKALQSDDLRGIAGGQEISGGGCPTQGVCTTAAFSQCWTQCGAKTSERGF